MVASPSACSRRSCWKSSVGTRGAYPMVTITWRAEPGTRPRPTRTASAVPSCGSWRAVTACEPMAASTRSPPWPVTTTRCSMPAAARETRTCSSMGRPASGWRTLGSRERIRVPCPAASTIAAVATKGSALLPERHCLDLDQGTLRQRLDADRRPGRIGHRKVPRVDLVDRCEVRHVDEEDRGLEHATRSGAGRVQYGGQVLKGSLGLRGDPVGKLAAGRDGAGLAGGEDEQIGANCLAVGPDGG